ncbi:hypothetical protein FIM12_03485 [SAR202 cluster bacterium AD-804-J14_MRT_500m]|nr:hypothetical protein [SAR202 cluster bacterium AD-804-J14_MRT_500m]
METKSLLPLIMILGILLLLVTCGDGSQISKHTETPITSSVEDSQGAKSTPISVPQNPESSQSRNMFNPQEFDPLCTEISLGTAITNELLSGRRTPTDQELAQITHCYTGMGQGQSEGGRQGTSQSSNTGQSGQSQNMFNPQEFDPLCTEISLGTAITNELLSGRRTPTDQELAQITHCYTGMGQGQSEGGRQGMDRSHGHPQDTKGRQDLANSTGDSQALQKVSTVETLPPGMFAATLHRVSLPDAGHSTPTVDRCETFDNTKCAELKWERIDGLLAGAVTTIQVSPKNPEIIYAGMDSNDMSLWKSENSGSSWELSHIMAHTSDIAISPERSSLILYSVLEEGVFRSTDNGTTWNTVIGSSELDWVQTSGLYFKALAFSSDSPSIAYAVASYERGPTFGDAEIFRSDTAGLTWTHTGSCTDCGSVYTIQVQPNEPNTIWVASDTGVHRSDNSGVTWAGNVVTGLAQYQAATIGLAVHPDNPKTFLASTANAGVYRSIDGGQTWNTSSTGLGNLKTHQIEFSLADYTVAYVTTHDGIYRSNDAGETWIRRDGGLSYTYTNAISIDPENPDIAYVGTGVELHTAHTDHINQGIHEGGGLYKTTNGGITWSRIDQEMEESKIVSMATHPYLPFSLWIGGKAGRGAFTTPDAGDTWLHAAWRAAHYPMVFAFSHSFPSVHFLTSSVSLAEITTSTDGGETWSTLASGLSTAVDQSSRANKLPSETDDYFHVHLHGLAVAPSNSSVLYTGSIYDPSMFEQYSMMGAVIFTSRDGGITWVENSNGFPIDTPTSLNAFVVHPTDPDTAYAMTSKYESQKAIGIYKTVDGGSNWKAVNSGIDLNTQDLQIDPLSPEILYAATESGVYKTIDAAKSWHLASSGLASDRNVFDLAINPLNPLQIYAATSSGVYKTKNGGNDWYSVNLGFPFLASAPFGHDRTIEIDATGQIIYVAVATKPDGFQGEKQVYRAIIEPLVTIDYVFDINDETIQLESNSHVYDMINDQNVKELHFTSAGPSGITGKIKTILPTSFFTGPFTVTVDGNTVETSVNGQSVYFEHIFSGRSAIIIKGK